MTTTHTVTATGDLVNRLHAVHERQFPHRPRGMMRMDDDTLVACLYFEERLAEVRAEVARLRQAVQTRPALKQADIERILRTSLSDPE